MRLRRIYTMAGPDGPSGRPPTPPNDLLNRDRVKNQVLLLVEDNAYDEALAVRAFHKNSLVSSVVVARDGLEALKYLVGDEGTEAARELPVLVLLDLKLPGIDGFELLRRVRANKRTRLLPVVVLSSSLEQDDVARSYMLGANSYIRKPVDFVEFVRAAANLGVYWLGLNQPPPPPEEI